MYCLRIYLERYPLLHEWPVLHGKMVEEGKTLFSGEEETYEKNVSESEDDSEEYVSAPIGKVVVVFSAGICFVWSTAAVCFFFKDFTLLISRFA